jgi:hypothetical protein
VGQAVYAIDAFPDDDLLWRIEWIGGVGYNTSVPSEPQIDVCLAQLPKGEKNPLSARARSSQVEKRTVKIGVGLLPYVWIGSVWQKRRPVITNLSAYRGRVSIDATSLRMVALGMATSRDNAIPRSSYLFGASWPNVCRTLLVTPLLRSSSIILRASSPQGQKWKTAILQAKVLGLFTTWLPHRHAGGCHQSLAYHSPEENRIDRAGRLSTFASAATRVRLG